ncbi:hypothetical protein ACFYW8_23235 [Streptomyces sp. NPDC002742]|uniref:hypothetical protein n=1 Tax=Streptomyces sp. NPDC002742 TaxID=3364663 RepID=UPI0036830FB9
METAPVEAAPAPDQVKAAGHIADAMRTFLLRARRDRQHPPLADDLACLQAFEGDDDLNPTGVFPQAGGAAQATFWKKYPEVVQRRCFQDAAQVARHWDPKALVIGPGDGYYRRQRTQLLQQASSNGQNIICLDPAGDEDNIREFISGCSNSLASSVTIATGSRSISAAVATCDNLVMANHETACGHHTGDGQSWYILDEASNDLPSREDLVVLPSGVREEDVSAIKEIFGPGVIRWADSTATAVVDWVLIGAMPHVMHVPSHVWSAAAAFVASTAGLFIHAAGANHRSLPRDALRTLFGEAMFTGNTSIPNLLISKTEVGLSSFVSKMAQIPGGLE